MTLKEFLEDELRRLEEGEKMGGDPDNPQPLSPYLQALRQRMREALKEVA